MMKMRLFLKKLVILIIVVSFLWWLTMYWSINDVPKSMMKRPIAQDMEKRLQDLEHRVNYQLRESSEFLHKLREKLKKTENVDKIETKDYTNKTTDPLKRVLPVLVIACDRITVRRCLDNLIKFRPSKEIFPIIVSQDCAHNKTAAVIKKYVDSDPTITMVRQPDTTEIILPKAKQSFTGYYRIARHYKFALNYVLNRLAHEAVIIVEDDLDISPDFFEYFLGTYPLLLEDPSLWCISAWNDNGKREVIELARPGLLHRTDFFPGLGWMMTRQSWLELEPKWPAAFFDDWLRDPTVTRGRSCIRPEVPRTYSFGKIGVSKGLFFDLHLRHMQLNMEFVPFTKLNLSYLLKEHYDKMLTSVAYSVPEMRAADVIASTGDTPVRVSYTDAVSFRKAAKKLGLMDDFRSGIPRTAYLGIVQCFIGGSRVYLAPSFTWVKYDPKWA